MGIIESDKFVTLINEEDNTTRVDILKHGATIISWKHKGEEKLWLSEEAKLYGSRPVRGGIPLVFPLFGTQKIKEHPTSKLPQHGFARNSTWEFLGQTLRNPLTVEFGLALELVDKEILSLWGNGNYKFKLFLTVQLGNDYLKTKIDVINVGNEPFEFNWLFHTYLKVPDITDILVNNLIDQQCYDQLLNECYTEKSPVITFSEEFDRIYKNIETNKIFQVIELGKVLINVHRENLPDTVIWNPWIEKSKNMKDFFPKDGYLKMLCIEPGQVSKFIKLPCGATWNGTQILSIGGAIKLQSNIY